jgi:hypothetical protein
MLEEAVMGFAALEETLPVITDVDENFDLSVAECSWMFCCDVVENVTFDTVLQ